MNASIVSIQFDSGRPPDVAGPFSDIVTGNTVISLLGLNNYPVDGDNRTEKRKQRRENAWIRLQGIGGEDGDGCDDESGEMGMIPLFHHVIITPESYQAACQLLGIKDGDTYAIAHKKYTRAKALYHPDRIPKELEKSTPKKPEDANMFEYGHRREEVLSEEQQDTCVQRSFFHDYLDMLEGELDIEFRYIHETVIEFREKYTGDIENNEQVGAYIRENHSELFGEIVNKMGVEFLVNRGRYSEKIIEFLFHHLYSQLDYLVYMEEKNKRKVKTTQWMNDKREKERFLEEKCYKNRQSLDEAWEIYQSSQGARWEDTKHLDIIWGESYWGNVLYRTIQLDRADCIVAKSFLKPPNDSVSSLLDEFENLGRSLFSPIELSYFTEVIVALRSSRYDEQKIRDTISLLRARVGSMTQEINSILDTIEQHPSLLSNGYKEHNFTPAVLFGRGRTWGDALYDTSYEIPLWKLFIHMYLQTTGKIPFRLGTLMVRKYFGTDMLTYDIDGIIHSIEEGRDIGGILDIYDPDKERIDTNDKYDPDKERIDTNDKYDAFAKDLADIRQGLCVRQEYAVGGGYSLGKIGLEVTQDGGIELYFTVNLVEEGPVNMRLGFSQKEVATMYLAALETNILDDHEAVLRRISSS